MRGLDKLFVVMTLQPWHQIEISCIGGFEVHVNGKKVEVPGDIPGIGFFPAFATREEAEEYAGPESQIMEVGRSELQ